MKHLLYRSSFVVFLSAILVVSLISMPTQATSFDIGCGDTAALINAVVTANTNGESDTINLAEDCPYTFDSAYDSENALPLITSPIVINGNGATLQRDPDGSNMRLLRISSGGDVTLNDLTIEGWSGPGAISNDGGSLTVLNSAVVNTTEHGIYNAGGTLRVESSLVTENRNVGIYNDANGIAHIVNSTIPQNDGYGVYNAGVMTVTSSTIAGNTVGGIISNGTLTLTNSLVSGNDSYGLYNMGVMTVTSSTIAGNGSRGIYSSATLTVTNSIIWGNGEFISAFGMVTVSSSVVEGGIVGGFNIINADPLFVAPVSHTSVPTTAGDYHIRLGSPAINAGSNADVPDELLYDIDGDARIVGGAVDIGVDENTACIAYAFPYTVATGDAADLVTAIHCANQTPAADDILLPPGEYVYTSAADIDAMLGDSALPRITTPITIRGLGADETEPSVIRRSGGPNFRLFQVVTGGDLTLDDNIVVRGGGNVVSAISNAGGSLTIRNSSVANNSILSIENTSGTLWVESSLVTGNGDKGIYNGPGGTTHIVDSTISANNGMGLHNEGVMTVTTSTITGNSGTGIYSNGTLTVINSLVSGNNGIGLYNDGVMTVMTSTIAGNSGNGIYNANFLSTLTVTNSIIWGNSASLGYMGTTTVSSSVVEGGIVGSGINNITADPLFVAPVSHTSAPTTAGDYHIRLGSPAINAGSNADVPVDLLYDIDGDTRIVGGAVDIGADENTACIAYAFPYTVATGDAADLVTAIHCANQTPAADDILLPPGEYVYTSAADIDAMLGDSALPRITTPITIRGLGADETEPSVIRRGGGPNFRMFQVVASGDLTLDNNIVVQGGALSSAISNAGGRLTIRTSSVRDNVGTGIRNAGGTLRIESSLVTGNGDKSIYNGPGGTTHIVSSTISANNGMGLHNEGVMTVTSSTIAGNSGEGIYNTDALTVTNSLVSGNGSSGILGIGGMTVTSSTIAGNGYIGIISSDTLTVTNSIVWGNYASLELLTPATISSSVVEGGVMGGGVNIITADPLFVAPMPYTSAPTTAGDYHIRLGSPAINAGSNDDVPDDLLYDIDGDDRIIGGIVDIGADENADCLAYAFPYTVAAGNTTDFVNAIHCANANADESVITLTAGTYSFISAADVDVTWGDSALPRITTPVVINGNGATIERAAGSAQFRLLRAVSGGALTLNDVTVTGGSSDNGGGILSMAAALRVNNSTISGNTATYGGGILGNAEMTVTNSTISGNSATDGGGLYIYFATATVTNSTISGNTATYGGGLYPYFSTVTVANSMISGNSATDGGGLYIHFTTATVTNSTISGNTAIDSGGLYSYGSTVTVANSIVWGNNSQFGGVTDTVTVSHSIIQGGFAGGTNVITADPLFVAQAPYTDAPTTAGDYHLQAASPAINAGSTAALPLDEYDLDDDGDTSERVPFDLDGNPRIRSTIVDIGAYEHTVDAGVNTDKDSVSVAEGGATDSVAIVLLARPGAPVTLSITAGGQVMVEPTELVFTPENWATPQSITVMALDDADSEGPHTDVIEITLTSDHADYNGYSITVDATIADNDRPEEELLLNGGFETKVSGTKLPEAWKVKAPKSIKVLCKPDKANSGDCALKFRHGTPVRGVVTQDIDLTGLTLLADDQLILSVYVRDGKVPARVKAVLRVVYEDGTKDKIKKGLTSDVGYELSTLPTLTLRATATAVRVRFAHKTANAALTIDDASLLLVPSPSVSRRGAGSDLILPPPALPDGFRGTN